MEAAEQSNMRKRQMTEESETQMRSVRIKKEPGTSFSSEKTYRLTDREKINLYEGLIQHGSSNISLLRSFVPFKSEESIKRFIDNHKRAARSVLMDGKEKAPIDRWLDSLASTLGEDKEKRFDLHRTLKYIALFEPHSPEIEDMLSDSYKLISDCLKGESPKHLDPLTSLFLYEHLEKLIRNFKCQNHDRERKHLTQIKKPVACYAGKKAANTAEEKRIISRISNPLKIPDSLLELKK